MRSGLSYSGQDMAPSSSTLCWNTATQASTPVSSRLVFGSRHSCGSASSITREVSKMARTCSGVSDASRS